MRSDSIGEANVLIRLIASLLIFLLNLICDIDNNPCGFSDPDAAEDVPLIVLSSTAARLQLPAAADRLA
jgi:hypothetical protein